MNKTLDNYLVEKYPKIFINRYGDMRETNMAFGFENRDGWFWILDQLCSSIQNYIDLNNLYGKEEKQIRQVIADQVKEKFGMLSFHHHGGDDYTKGMIRLAESMSMSTCEFCGSTKNIGKTSGWVYTICKECYDSPTIDNSFNIKISQFPWKESASRYPMEAVKELRKIKIDKLNKT